MRGGASLCKPLGSPGGFRTAPVVDVSGKATMGRMWAESQKVPMSSRGLFLSMQLGQSAWADVSQIT